MFSEGISLMQPEAILENQLKENTLQKSSLHLYSVLQFQ